MEREAVLVTFRQDFTCHQSSPPCDKLTVNIASVHYTHSATFVSEVQGFVCDFQVSLAKMRDSIKDAAVGVAKGLVRQVTQPFNSEMNESISSPPNESQSNDASTCGDSPSPFASRHHLFDVKVATPVVILPKSSHSEDCILIHLGQVSLSNSLLPYMSTGDDKDGCLHPSQEGAYYEEISVEIANVSMQAVSGFDLSLYVPTRELQCSTLNQRCFKIVNEVSATMTIHRGIDGLKVMKQENIVNGSQKGEGWDLDDSFSGQLVAKQMQFDVIVSGKVEEPISLKMSKDVLEQIKSTLRNIARQSPSMSGVHQSDDEVPTVSRHPSEGDPLPSGREDASASSSPSLALSASFVLPKLSLELEHFDKKFVFVMLQDFAVEATRQQPFETHFDLKLGSIVIEDLLQSEESRYRYIFLTSSKLFPNVPIVSSFGRSAFRGVSKYMTTPTFPAHLFTRPAASSSPKKERDSHAESPLRAFSRNATSLDDTHRGAGSGSQPRPSLKAESDTFICIKGLLVDQNSPSFASKYDSVSVPCRMSRVGFCQSVQCLCHS